MEHRTPARAAREERLRSAFFENHELPQRLEQVAVRLDGHDQKAADRARVAMEEYNNNRQNWKDLPGRIRSGELTLHDAIGLLVEEVTERREFLHSGGKS